MISVNSPLGKFLSEKRQPLKQGLASLSATCLLTHAALTVGAYLQGKTGTGAPMKCVENSERTGGWQVFSGRLFGARVKLLIGLAAGKSTSNTTGDAPATFGVPSQQPRP